MLGTDEARRLDIPLRPGVTFRAKLTDSLTGKPVAGTRLSHWQYKGVEGRSGRDGIVTIAEMLPGAFSFDVDAPEYATGGPSKQRRSGDADRYCRATPAGPAGSATSTRWISTSVRAWTP